jgi:4-amino-4-deoxy-L-arabinose transferase-like glycosyltransferase
MEPSESRIDRVAKNKTSWTIVLAISVVISALAAFRGGYVGPDYSTHLGRLVEWGKVFDFSTTSPPIYYIFGNLLFRLIGYNNVFPITLSIIQIFINALALWWFFIYTAPHFKSSRIHFALVCLLTFLPVRMIHATTVGTDSTTIPLFVLLLHIFAPLLKEKTATIRNVVHFGAALSLAVFTKYSFMAMMPAVFVIFIGFALKRHWKVQRFIALCLIALLLPTLLTLYSFWASSKVHGYNTEKHWLPKGTDPDMGYRDLLTVHQKDVLLFEAPEYFKREILEGHKHSYLGLSHLGIFTDTMNLFQVLTVPQRIDTYLGPEQKIRENWKTKVMVGSMSLGLIWTLLALAGTAWTFFLALKDLVRGRFNSEDLTALFGVAYFLLMYLPIPFVYAGDLYGYWTPRLILPPLLYFFSAGMLLFERKINRRAQVGASVIFALVAIQCAIEIVMLL